MLEKGTIEDRRDIKDLSEKWSFMEKRNQDLLQEVTILNRNSLILNLHFLLNLVDRLNHLTDSCGL